MSETLSNLPVLEGWVTIGQAAEMLGVTRQHAWRKAKLASEGLPGGWHTCRRVGDKPTYVVSLREVHALMLGLPEDDS